MTPDQLFSKASRKPNGCVTIDSRSRQKYWGVRFRGKVQRAHRVAWILAKGEIPGGMCVCHHCDTPRCVNIDHLFLGSVADNVRDMDSKGRRRNCCGESNGLSKLTDAEVSEIREMADSSPVRIIAEIFGVSVSNIRRIIAGQIWKHTLAAP